MATAILIAGMHRSGTSAAAGALQLLGVSLGRDLLAAAADNPKGYFENERAVQIHERLLQGMGSSWDDVRPLPSDWVTGDAASEARDSIRKLVVEEFAGHSIWAIKDPRICRFIPLWQSVLDELGIQAVSLMVARRPVEVAASIAKRNGWAPSLGKLLWMRHVFEAEAATREMTRTVITYENLLRDPHGCLRNAMERLHLEVPGVAPPAKDIATFVDARYRHHVDTQSASDPLQTLLEDVYRELVSIEAGAGHWNRVRGMGGEAEALVSGGLPYIDAVAAKAARHRAELLDMEVSRFQVQSQLNAQISWSEEAVVRERSLHERLEASASRLQELTVQQQALEARYIQLQDDRPVLGGQNEQLRREQADLESAVRDIEEVVRRLSSDKQRLYGEVARLSLELDQIVGSRSWRWTRPLRAIANHLRS